MLLAKPIENKPRHSMCCHLAAEVYNYNYSYTNVRMSAATASMAEWLRAWGTLAMMKLWRREVVSSIPDRGTIVG